jgi:uncharacterized protein (UPF0248 family)
VTSPPAVTEGDARLHLEELANRIAAAEDVLDDSREARDRAIVTYAELGIPHRRIAEWAKCHRKVVYKALAKPPPD